MSELEFSHCAKLLFALLICANLFGRVFTWLRQPRLVGELLAGIILGPSFAYNGVSTISGLFPTSISSVDSVAFLYHLGLVLLMFLAGIEMADPLRVAEKRKIAWLALIGTACPIIFSMIVASMIPLQRLMGRTHSRESLLIVVAVAIGVTSVPVISRIFMDAGIMRTRFATLILSVATIEDILLWLLLTIALAMASNQIQNGWETAATALKILIFLFASITIAPRVISVVAQHRTFSGEPVCMIFLLILFYCVVSELVGINLTFASLLAGFAIGRNKPRLKSACNILRRVGFEIFIPLYFALVGFRLNLGSDMHVESFLIVFGLGCTIKIVSVYAGAWVAGFRGLECWNLAIVMNARGGPGIVVASVAYEAGIINVEFYTIMIVTAVLTSQIAGIWILALQKRKLPLLYAS